MVYTKYLFSFLLLWAGRSYGQSLDSIKLIKPGASLVQVANKFIFTEGPAVDKKGNIYFTDQPNDKIWKYSVDGTLTEFLNKPGRSNGLYFDKKGNIIACADENNELWMIDKNGKPTVLLNQYKGHKLNGPNDLWIDQKGSIYFTDPYYQRNYWQRKKPDLPNQCVYYLANGKKEAVIVDSSLVQPNGIVGSADGKYLFVADIKANKTYKYAIGKNGNLLNKQVFAPLGSDGMTLDNKGNLYLTGKGVTIYDKTGKRVGNIPVPSNWVGNICFGGKDFTTLFITASESVYTLQMQVRGVE